MKFSDNYIKDLVVTAQPIAKPEEDLWSYVQQEFDSKNTSQKQNPSAIQYLLKNLQKEHSQYYGDDPNRRFNLDIGGGRWDLGSNLLQQQKIKNYIYDPFNRTKEENDLAISQGRGGKSPTVTVSNVLNVIKEPEIRERVIKQAADAVDPLNGVAVFSIYFDPKWVNDPDVIKNGGRPTLEGSWQNHKLPKFYVPEIQKYFKEVVQRGNIIVAKGPIVSWRGQNA